VRNPHTSGVIQRGPNVYMLIAVLAGSVGACLILAWALYPLIDAFYEWRETNVNLLMTLFSGIALAVAGAVIWGAYGLARSAVTFSQNKALQAGIVRLENDHPVMAAHIQRGYTLQEQQFLGSLLALHYQNQNEWARHSDYRNVNNWAPSYHGGSVAQIAAEPAAPTALPAPMPGGNVLEHLLGIGHICRSGNSVMIGYDAMGTPQYMEWDQSPLTAVAGASNMGKTSTVRFVLSQMGINAGSLPVGIVLVDPHGNHPEKGLAASMGPLSKMFLRAPAIGDSFDAMLTNAQAAVNYIEQIGEDRRTRADYKAAPVLLVIDEFTALVSNLTGEDKKRAETFTRKLLRVANEFNKYGVRGLLIGQSWNADLAGGTALRSGIQSLIVHGCREHQAKFLLNTELAKQAETLGKGEVLFQQNWNADPIRCRVPYVSAADVAAVGERVRPAPAIAVGRRALPAEPTAARLDISEWSRERKEALVRKLAVVRDGDKWRHGTRKIAEIVEMDYNQVVKVCREAREAA
jgi:hypothetical protein